MYRKSLTLSLFAVIVVGILFSFVPFTSSLEPNDDSLNNAPHFDLALIQKGQITEFDVPQFKLILAKQSNDEIIAFAIPANDGLYLLPEFNWQRPILPCKSLIQNESFQCLDTINNAPVWYSFMKWGKNGKYIGENKWGKKIPDLLIPKYKITADQFIFLGV